MNQLPLTTPRALTRVFIISRRHPQSLNYSTAAKSQGSKVIQTTLLLGGGGAAGLGGYYFYDPNAEIFKQARSALGLESSSSKQAAPDKKKVQKKSTEAQIPAAEQKKLIRSESSSSKDVKPVITPPAPQQQQQQVPQKVSPVKPIAAASAAAVAATAISVSTPPPPPLNAPPKPAVVVAAPPQKQSDAATAAKPDSEKSSEGVPRHVLITALRAQQEALSESHDAKIKTIQNEYDRRLSNATQVIEAERVVDLRAKYEKASAALQAIELGIEARTTQNTRAKRLRALWAQVNAVYARVNHPEYHSSTTTTIDKSRLITAIEVEDKFVRQMVSSLPNQPVHSLESLKQRFYDDVEPLAKSVTLIRDGEGFSIWKYALGSLFASALAKVNRAAPDASAAAAATPSSSSPVQQTANSLDSARSALEKSDLLTAAIAVNQLTGLPRQVASDWLADARTLLETNQTLFVLMTYAASNNVF